jgi:hypothetical protein
MTRSAGYPREFQGALLSGVFLPVPKLLTGL